jgi:separase
MCIQVGKIYEMIGDATEAVAYFKSGKEIASSFKLPSFVVVFASMLGMCSFLRFDKLLLFNCKKLTCQLYDLLGKVYSQQSDKLKFADYEIGVALKLLKDNKNFICQKCKLIMQATLHQYRGDLCQIKSGEDAVKLYEDGLDKLLLSDWKNNTSCLRDRYRNPVSIKCSCSLGKTRNEEKKKGNTKGGREAGTLSIHGGESSMAHANPREIDCTTYSSCSPECILSDKGCWHCLQSKVGKTGLLCDLIDLKWEFVRRKMCMKLLSRSGMSIVSYLLSFTLLHQG